MRQSVTVRDGWEGIVTALASAEPETVVELERGTYSGSSTLHIPQGVTILGRAAVLDFSGTGPVIAAHDVARVAVEDETIDAGRADIPFCRQPGEDPFDPSEEQTWVEWGLIWFQQTDRASLSNVSIMGCGKTVPGVYVSESAGTSLESLQVDHARHGVVFANARGGRIKRGQFFENDLFGIVLTQSQGISIVSNRCHDNTQSGILLVSSDSEAVEDNECWGNGSSGIALQRDERSPDAASHARLTGNRCHDNTQSGIVLFSPDSEAVEDNECWGNGSSGIALQRDERSPDAASHARLTGNRCHDN
ncbi:MAG: right-handed parallel beta-helix repeat-containing protein, partial [Pseudomonadota bacterium]